MTDETDTTWSTAAALGGAATISFSAIFFRLAGVSPLTGTFFRMLYALPLLAVIVWLQRGRDLRSLRERALAMAAGVFLAVDIAFWHGSIDVIGAGLATLIVNSQVVIVPLVTWAVFKERPSVRALWAMPVVMAGLALITGLGREDSFGERPVLGVVLAVLAAFLYSGFLITFRRANRSLTPAAAPLLDASLGAAVAAGVVGGLAGELSLTPTWPAHGWLLALAWGPQVVGWLAIGFALPRLPAAQTSFAILLQPTLTLVWGRLIFGENPSLVQILGAVLVLVGILTVSTRRSTPVPIDQV